MTGSLSDAARDVGLSAEPAAASRVVALRRVLSDIATLAASTPFRASDAATASAIAERVLRVDPSSKALQAVANDASAAAAAMTGGRDAAAREALDRASTGVVLALRRDLLDAPAASAAISDRLNGALVDALRARRPQ